MIKFFQKYSKKFLKKILTGGLLRAAGAADEPRPAILYGGERDEIPDDDKNFGHAAEQAQGDGKGACGQIRGGAEDHIQICGRSFGGWHTRGRDARPVRRHIAFGGVQTASLLLYARRIRRGAQRAERMGGAGGRRGGAFRAGEDRAAAQGRPQGADGERQHTCGRRSLGRHGGVHRQAEGLRESGEAAAEQ